MNELSMRGVVQIKNVSGAPYAVEELDGHVLQDQETVDLLDDSVPVHYDDHTSANRLVTELDSAKLRQDIQSGDIEVVLNTAPLLT